MDWTTVSTELNNNQTQIRGSDVRGLSVQGGYLSIDWSQLDTKISKGATVFSLLFLSLPSHGGSLPLYSSLWVILVLRLSIIWAPTWVSILLDTLSGLLWVMVTKAALFKSLLHINVAKKNSCSAFNAVVAASLRYFWVSCYLVCLWGMCLSLELLGGSL